MSEQTHGSDSLPEFPNLDWLRKQARRRLNELRKTDPSVKLADAQFDLSKQYGFTSWRALKTYVDSLTIDGQLFAAAREGNVNTLKTLLDKYPDKLYARAKPYEWTLLHTAAQKGHFAAVDLLLKRGLDVNTREEGDNTYAMHWAAAAGHIEVVRRLADAGGDVVGHAPPAKLLRMPAMPLPWYARNCTGALLMLPSRSRTAKRRAFAASERQGHRDR